MMVLQLEAEVTDTGELQLELPTPLPPGRARITIEIPAEECLSNEEIKELGSGKTAQASGEEIVVKALLDTTIVVDLLRDHPPAVAWLEQQQENNDLGVPPAVWLEIIDGAQNLKAQRKAIELLRRFDRILMAPEDFDWAIEQALRFRLSHNVDVMDCLIAAPSHRLRMTLYTRNLKHFQRILGDAACDPYPSPENAQASAAGKTAPARQP